MQHAATKFVRLQCAYIKETCLAVDNVSASKLLFRCVHLTSQAKLDHYEVLGAKRDATANEIKQLYLQKCKLYHPDKHKSKTDTHEKFVQIQEAYSTLSNPATKKDYDRGLQFRDRGFSRQDGSTYSWSQTHTRAKPEDVWKTWQSKAHNRTTSENRYRSGTYQQNNGRTYYSRDYGANSQQNPFRRKNPYNAGYYEDPLVFQDRLNSYWESVYKQKGEKHSTGGKANRNTINGQERLMISFFLVTLFILLWIRVSLSLRQNSRPSLDGCYDVPHRNVPRDNRRPPKSDGGIEFEEA